MASPARDQKLGALLSSAARVFAERGYHHTSMRDLARFSGVSLAGVYYYVQSKEELLYLIQSRAWEGIIAGMRTATKGITDSIDCLNRFIDNHLDYFVAHSPEMRVLAHEGEALTGDFLRRVTERRDEYTKALLDILTDLEKAHGPPLIPQNIAAQSLFGMMNWIYHWYDAKTDQKIDALSRNISRLFLGGYIALPPQGAHAASK